MAYVYKHIRLDTNLPFYIGIGSDEAFKRAHSKASRNRFWHNVVNKTGYSVEIIENNVTWEESLLLEVKWIAFYGRREHGGLLINLTDGGEGNVGYITLDEAKAKQSKAKLGKAPPNKGKPMPPHQIEILRQANLGRPSWNKGIPLSAERRAAHSAIMKGRESTFKGFKHTDAAKEKNRRAHLGKTAWNKGIPSKPEAIEKMRASKKGGKSWNKGQKMSEEWKKQHPNGNTGNKVVRMSLDGEVLEVFDSVREAALHPNYNWITLKFCLRGKLKTYRGFKWAYEKSLQTEAFTE